MLQRLLNLANRLLRWSPLGEDLRLLAGEGPGANALRGLSGRISEVGQDESNGVELFKLELYTPATLGGKHVASLLLVPRHAQYGLVALRNSCISAYVFIADGQAVSRSPEYESMIALMDVCRRKHLG